MKRVLNIMSNPRLAHILVSFSLHKICFKFFIPNKSFFDYIIPDFSRFQNSTLINLTDDLCINLLNETIVLTFVRLIDIIHN